CAGLVPGYGASLLGCARTMAASGYGVAEGEPVMGCVPCLAFRCGLVSTKAQISLGEHAVSVNTSLPLKGWGTVNRRGERPMGYARLLAAPVMGLRSVGGAFMGYALTMACTSLSVSLPRRPPGGLRIIDGRCRLLVFACRGA